MTELNARVARMETIMQHHANLITKLTELCERMVRLEERLSAQQSAIAALQQREEKTAGEVNRAAPALAIGKYAAGIAASLAAAGMAWFVSAAINGKVGK